MDALISYITLFAASSIAWMIINHKRTLAQIGKPRKFHPIIEIQMPVKKQKIEKIEEFKFQGHESVFGKLEKSIQPREERVIVVPGYSEVGIGTQDLLESPELELRRLTSNEKIDADRTRKNLLGSKLCTEKRNASFYSGNNFRVKRNRFYEQLSQVVGSPKTKPYGTLDPVLGGQAKSVEFDSRNIVKTSEKQEKTVIDLGFKPVRNENFDMSMTTRFELPGAKKDSILGKGQNSLSENLNFGGTSGNKTPLFGASSKNDEKKNAKIETRELGFGETARNLVVAEDSAKKAEKEISSSFLSPSERLGNTAAVSAKSTTGSLFGQNDTKGGLFGDSMKNNEEKKTEASGLSGSLFGNGFSGFGNNSGLSDAKSSAGSLFGQTDPKGGLFGNPAKKNEEKTAEPPGLSGGLFGSTATGFGNNSGLSDAKSTTGSLFGQTDNKGGLFGEAKPGLGLGGNPKGDENEVKKPEEKKTEEKKTEASGFSGGLFGNGLSGFGNNSGLGDAKSSAGSLFGQTDPKGGLFGNPAKKNEEKTAEPPGLSGGLFGNTVPGFGNNSGLSDAKSTTGSLFGQSNPKGGLFGDAKPGPGLGGNLTGAKNPESSGFSAGLFGNNVKPTTGPLFGQGEAKAGFIGFANPIQSLSGNSLEGGKKPESSVFGGGLFGNSIAASGGFGK